MACCGKKDILQSLITSVEELQLKTVTNITIEMNNALQQFILRFYDRNDELIATRTATIISGSADTNIYTVSASYNGLTGVLTFTRNDDTTYSVAITSITMADVQDYLNLNYYTKIDIDNTKLPPYNVAFTGASVSQDGSTLILTRKNEQTVNIPLGGGTSGGSSALDVMWSINGNDIPTANTEVPLLTTGNLEIGILLRGQAGSALVYMRNNGPGPMRYAYDQGDDALVAITVTSTVIDSGARATPLQMPLNANYQLASVEVYSFMVIEHDPDTGLIINAFTWTWRMGARYDGSGEMSYAGGAMFCHIRGEN